MASKQAYRAENARWFEEKSQATDVVPLAEGVCYRVVTSSKDQGRQPQPSSIVVVHYTGWTIDGRQFDSSREDNPLAIRLRELIEGWQIALSHMRVGDRWEVYIDAARGYGQRPQAGIPAGSTLIFDIELLNVV